MLRAPLDTRPAPPPRSQQLPATLRLGMWRRALSNAASYAWRRPGAPCGAAEGWQRQQAHRLPLLLPLRSLPSNGAAAATQAAALSSIPAPTPSANGNGSKPTLQQLLAETPSEYATGPNMLDSVIKASSGGFFLWFYPYAAFMLCCCLVIACICWHLTRKSPVEHAAMFAGNLASSTLMLHSLDTLTSCFLTHFRSSQCPRGPTTSSRGKTTPSASPTARCGLFRVFLVLHYKLLRFPV